MCNPSQGQPRGNMMPPRPLFRFQICSHFSDVSACLRLDVTTSAPASSGKGMRDDGSDCGVRVCHEGLQTKGYRGSHMSNSSSAHPFRKRKWLQSHPSEHVSACPCRYGLAHTHKGTLFSLVFKSKPNLGVTLSLCWFTLKYFGIIYTLRVASRHSKNPNQAWHSKGG